MLRFTYQRESKQDNTKQTTIKDKTDENDTEVHVLKEDKCNSF